jgi:hypothetical protein
MVLIIKWRNKSIFIMIVRFLATNQIRQGLKFNWICCGLLSMDSATADKCGRLSASKEIEINLVASLQITK